MSEEFYIAMAVSDRFYGASEIYRSPGDAIADVADACGYPWVAGYCILQCFEVANGIPYALWYRLLDDSDFEYYGIRKVKVTSE